MGFAFDHFLKLFAFGSGVSLFNHGLSVFI